MKRQRGRNRKPGGNSGNANSANPNRSWDSQGPENIKVRGNAQTVYERYQQLARDAGSSGDRVLAENYLQHAEHYFRVLRALQPQRPVSEIAARELSNQGYDIDFEDETGAQAAAFLAAQQAADRAAQGGEARDNDGQNRDNQNRSEGQSGQNREWRDRDNQDRDRSQNRDYQNRDNQNRDRDRERDRAQNRDREAQASEAQPRAEGQSGDEPRADGEGGRRETRRERWERRREERNRRFEAEGGQPDTRTYDEAEGGNTAETVEPAAVVGTIYEPAADDVAPARVERPRRTRATREPVDTSDAPVGLPSFLTRSSAPAPVVQAPVVPADPVADAGDEPAAPKRRAPRRKVEAVTDGDV